jgi:hypothetical protein
MLRALQWFVAAGVPGDFDGYGEKAGVALTAGGSITGQSIAMTAVTLGNITGTITVPAGYAIHDKSLNVVFPDNGIMAMGTGTGAGASFTYVVPAITGATISLEVTSVKGTAISYARKSLGPLGPAKRDGPDRGMLLDLYSNSGKNFTIVRPTSS